MTTILQSANAQKNKTAIRTGHAYSIYPDKVVQGRYEAKAVSRNKIVSNYKSDANLYIRPRVDFKFSINGKDNEMPVGTDHHINCLAAYCETPLIKFGEQFNDASGIPERVFLQPNTKLKIRLDMRHVFADFDSKGFFETSNGQRVYKEDFKGVYVAGNMPPLTWDFDNLHNFHHLQLLDDDGDHIYELELVLNKLEDKKSTNSEWTSTVDVSSYPKYTSDYVMHDAIYNLSLEEMVRAVEKDSTLRTGKEWAGVWTRDVSYSIILSMAILQPKVAQISLMRKVKDGVIIQDTGTGGAYPVSTDRMIWAVAAYEIYKVTGDTEWLKTVYPIIKKSLEADLLNAIDAETGLVKGESSFLDWREQTYPSWMEPAYIFESLALGTNAVHYEAHNVLARIAEAVGDITTSQKHKNISDGIRNAINTHLWMAEKGFYGQYMYGRNYKIISPKAEALGEALCVLFDIADKEKQKEIVQRTPVTEFGITCIYPQIPNIPPYHNNGIWPFVQAYWTLACAKAGNDKAVTESLSAILRPSALFLTNKENFVGESGDFVGTQINSDNMLWSLSGNLGVVYKVLFGLNYSSDGLTFQPMVPRVLQGKRTLSNYKYRNATLDVEVNGYGNQIKKITLDGKPLADATISSRLEGRHKIVIELANNNVGGEINFVKNVTAPSAPIVSVEGSTLKWSPVEGAAAYKVFYNGRETETTTNTSLAVANESYGEYQVIAVNGSKVESFASEPVIVASPSLISIVELEDFLPKANQSYKGFSGKGFIQSSLKVNASFSFEVDAPADGLYSIDFRYSNGNGPVNTENKCAIRGLKVNSKDAGTLVFPQRGTDEWSEWGFSNSLKVRLKKGSNRIDITYEPHHENMNGPVNEAMLDYARIIRL